MHIGVLCDPGNFHTQKWAEALYREGVEVTIFSMLPEVHPFIPTVYIPPRFARNGSVSYLSYLYTADRLRAVLEEHKVDILNPINVTPYGVWARRSGFRPIAMVAMGADILEYPPQRALADFPLHRSYEVVNGQSILQRWTHPLKWKAFRREIKKALDASAFITGDNRVLTEAVESWFGIPGDRIYLNRWGVEPEKFEWAETDKKELQDLLGIQEGQTVVLSPRGMKPIYQGDIILTSFESIVPQYPHVKFIMLSAGYEVPDHVWQQAQRLAQACPNFCFYEELIPRAHVLKLWNWVDIMISTPVYDGYSNALGEARYAGAIPIVNDIPAHRELIVSGQNGLVVDPFNAPHLAKVLGNTLDHLSTYRETFAPVNRQWIEEHGMLTKNIRRFCELCEDLLA